MSVTKIFPCSFQHGHQESGGSTNSEGPREYINQQYQEISRVSREPCVSESPCCGTKGRLLVNRKETLVDRYKVDDRWTGLGVVIIGIPASWRDGIEEESSYGESV